MNVSRRKFLGVAALAAFQNTALGGYEKLPGESDKERNPYLHSVFKRTRAIYDAENLKVLGKIPEEISGTYYRNGPNPRYKTDPHHWFDGDGMIHRLEITNGKAEYSNR